MMDQVEEFPSNQSRENQIEPVNRYTVLIICFRTQASGLQLSLTLIVKHLVHLRRKFTFCSADNTFNPLPCVLSH